MLQVCISLHILVFLCFKLAYPCTSLYSYASSLHILAHPCILMLQVCISLHILVFLCFQFAYPCTSLYSYASSLHILVFLCFKFAYPCTSLYSYASSLHILAHPCILPQSSQLWITLKHDNCFQVMHACIIHAHTIIYAMQWAMENWL